MRCYEFARSDGSVGFANLMWIELSRSDLTKNMKRIHVLLSLGSFSGVS